MSGCLVDKRCGFTADYEDGELGSGNNGTKQINWRRAMEAKSEARISHGRFFTAGGSLIALSILAYGVSFFLPAFTTNDGDRQPILGFVAFVMGLLGLVMVQSTWLANPAYWIGFIFVACRFWKTATVFGVLATCFALASLMIYEPGAAPPPHPCTSLSGIEFIRLTTILPGYWCWLASTVLFLSGCTVQLVSSAAQRHRVTSSSITERPT